MLMLLIYVYVFSDKNPQRYPNDAQKINMLNQ